MVISLLCPLMTEWRSSGVSSSSYKGTNPIMGVLTSWPHLNWLISQSPYLQILSCLELGFHHPIWGGGTPALRPSWWLRGEEPTCNAGDAGSIPELGDPLEKEMATHFSIPRGPWWATYSSWGLKRVRYNLAAKQWQQQHKHSFHNTVIENSHKWDIQVD